MQERSVIKAFEIYQNSVDGVENSSVTIYPKDRHYMYNWLVSHYDIDDETAIDIDSWSELATVDEVYTTDYLTIICKG